MEFQDRQLTCMDCQQPFLFSAGEQEFYSRKGFREEPKRCKPCRDSRKNRRMSGAMAGLDDGNGHNGNGHNGHATDDDIGNRAATANLADDAGNRAGYDTRAPRAARPPRDSGRAPRELFDATCAQCGGAARVPFRPVAGRPVYCRDCFGNRAGA